jgi:hypothetical protein
LGAKTFTLPHQFGDLMVNVEYGKNGQEARTFFQKHFPQQQAE